MFFRLPRLLTVNKHTFRLIQKFSTKAKRKKDVYQSELFPDRLFNKKHKTPSHLYLANPNTADLIDRCIEPYLATTQCDTILEFNPGIGSLSKKLLERDKQFKKIILMETLEHFMPQLAELQMQAPNRVAVVHGDFINIWKLVYQDRVDNGNRLAELFKDIPKRNYNDDINMIVFGAVGSYSFFKHLINSIIFQNSLFSFGRCEMFLLVPPPIYVHLTCSNEIGYMIYRSVTILFQIFFEHRFITRVPRDHFLPDQINYSLAKHKKLRKINSIDPGNLYLIRIVPRRNLLDLCPTVDLQALWYFIKQNCVSRRNRIIPNLEKWIPWCGPRLIINQQKVERPRLLYPDEDPNMLPQYSKPCNTLSSRDFYQNMNIFTQFGDLTPSQMFTLFRQFRRWPEYSESSFLASLENSLLKLEMSSDEGIDTISSTNEEDDIASSDSGMEHGEDEPPRISTSTSANRKKVIES